MKNKKKDKPWKKIRRPVEVVDDQGSEECKSIKRIIKDGAKNEKR